MNRPYLNKTGFNKLAQSIKDYINRKITGYAKLGTASTKDFTTYVSPTQTEQLPISSSVYSAMTNMLRGAYHPAGSKTIAELTSDLLVKANLGNVYKITEDGVTSDLFIGGAEQTIKTGDNAIVLFASEDTYKFSLESGVVDLDAYQKKELTQTIEGANTVEDALSALSNGKASKVSSAVKNDLVALDVNGNLVDSGKSAEHIWKNLTSATQSIDPNGLEVFEYVSYPYNNNANLPTKEPCTVYTYKAYYNRKFQICLLSGSQYSLPYIWIRKQPNDGDSWSSWQRLVSNSDLTSSVIADSTAPITSGGVYNAINKTTSIYSTITPSDTFNWYANESYCKRVGNQIIGYISVITKTTAPAGSAILTGLPAAVGVQLFVATVLNTAVTAYEFVSVSLRNDTVYLSSLSTPLEANQRVIFMLNYKEA